MPDVWSSVAELDEATQSLLADVLETRGADPKQRGMRVAFLDSIPFPAESRVLDIGCGTGVLTRALAGLPAVAEVVGVDPAPSLLERARALTAGLGNVSFLEGDARALPMSDADFDVLVFDSTLSHVPDVERALSEAHRVSRSEGWLAVFDGDYATTTVALSDHDPLQQCVEAMMATSVNDRYLMRRLPSLLDEHGFEVVQFDSHGFVDMASDGYMMTVVERGIDLLRSEGQIGETTAVALTEEARYRSSQGRFFGHIAYASLLARRSA